MSKSNNISVKIIDFGTKKAIKKESTQNDSTNEVNSGDLLQPLYDYDGLVQLYEENVYHQRCINVKAHAVAGVGFSIVHRDENEKANPNDEEYKKIKEFVDNHPTYAGQSFIETLTNFVTDFAIFGDAYFEASPNNKGEIAEIYHLKTVKTRLKIDDSTEKNRMLRRLAVQVSNIKQVKFYPYSEKYRKDRPQEDGKKANYYYRLSAYTPKESIYGAPEYISALIAISLMRSGQSYNLHFLDNFGMPAFAVIVNNGELSPSAFKSLQTFLKTEYKGVENAGKGIVLETGDIGENVKIEIQELSKAPKDAFFKVLKLDARDDIISAHGVPPRLVAVSSGANKLGDTTETKEQMKMFQEVVIAPIQNRVEELLNTIFQQGMGIEKYKIQLNPFYVADPKDDAEYYTKMIINGVLDADESREELGYQPRKIEPEVKAENVVKGLIKLKKELQEAIIE